jgi:hypothetical protein
MVINGSSDAATNSYRDEDGLTPTQRTWLEHIERCEAESVSFKSYCAREGLSSASLYDARKTLRRKGVLSSTALKAAAAPPRFAAVRLSQPSAGVATEVLLPNGVQLRVSCTSVADVDALIGSLSKL